MVFSRASGSIWGWGFPSWRGALGEKLEQPTSRQDRFNPPKDENFVIRGLIAREAYSYPMGGLLEHQGDDSWEFGDRSSITVEK